MNSLHIVSTSPTSGTAFADCLRSADQGDTLLLTQDGVYAAMNTAANMMALIQDATARQITIYALLADVDARGLAGRLNTVCHLVDDNGFVELTERHPRILSWF
jgi:tRNA 2-thiouridine synthesizing protein B